MLWSLDLAVRAANGEKIDEQDDINKSIFLFKKELKIKNSSIEKKTYDNVVNILANSGVELFERIKKTLYNFNELFHDVEVGTHLLKKLSQIMTLIKGPVDLLFTILQPQSSLTF
ncbi:hypothetical protein [Niabella hibiscisoli]|uniref:hypothetical protein n=1 Tax=Niabella hibiscisoli TaxID=1825928 RepID=UPI001F0F2BA9|nr:hypothetical protein [Niabella hibiscisoli]MCH5715226.1 hypothetical protein [Niabella hibiscisoli]